ncbi:hypothetical protein HY36_16165 [Hyphomonas atlantica]|uniref:Uncharacterized protein n=1 Tax=Hyphomonas atlantica TaxID=1280948 RepID=A0A059E306_9PROT|nr:hypothetical protein HY36_16165 [Hyphomonas atlantica]
MMALEGIWDAASSERDRTRRGGEGMIAFWFIVRRSEQFLVRAFAM